MIFTELLPPTVFLLNLWWIFTNQAYFHWALIYVGNKKFYPISTILYSVINYSQICGESKWLVMSILFHNFFRCNITKPLFKLLLQFVIEF